MNQVDVALESLCKAVKNSMEYRRYQHAKEELHKDLELERRVHEFRSRNFRIQNSGGVNLFDEVDKLEKENTELRNIPIVEEYMSSELALCRIVQKINWSIVEQLDFDLGDEQ